MKMRKLPFDKAWIEETAKKWPTPFHVYDAKAIRENARRLKKAFAWNKGFREYFAVKAAPNPHLMKMLKEFDFGSDCSSMAELILAEKVGNVGEAIMFTSNDTPAEEFKKAWELGAIINLDDITHWDFLLKAVGGTDGGSGTPAPRPMELESHVLCCRYNPGPLKGGNAIIGKPEEAKYGFTREQLFDCYAKMKAAGVTRFGLHTMVASNELDPEYIIDTAKLLFTLAWEIHEKVGIDFEFVNIGGGIGIPYKPDQKAMSLERVGEGIRDAYAELVEAKGMKPIRLYMECGRCITGPYGYLVAKVRHIKNTYRLYAGLDACMSNLMRPALYGAYHEIVVPGKENAAERKVYDVTGSLCENNDKFAIQRELPVLEPGDYVVICDAGAHGHAMGFQYNGKLRSAELLLEEDGSVREIRRAETLADYFATLSFPGSEFADIATTL
ncbi:MAG: diaminopimelate decarboxylase [Kiritimatiellae bacterium]|nr:diaminopimelate decarboxylase [Kiritimatiellia bacterium]